VALSSTSKEEASAAKKQNHHDDDEKRVRVHSEAFRKQVYAGFGTRRVADGR
jgi:hypothetical protein